MNRSNNCMKKRRSNDKPKSDLTFAPIAIKCSLFTENGNPMGKHLVSSSNINSHQIEKTIKSINKITTNFSQNTIQFDNMRKGIPQLSTAQRNNNRRQLQTSYLHIQQTPVLNTNSEKKVSIGKILIQDGCNQIKPDPIDTINQQNPNSNQQDRKKLQQIISPTDLTGALCPNKNNLTKNCIRRNIYRSRKEKRKHLESKTKSSLTAKKQRVSDNKKLIMLYRYQITSLMNVLCKKQDYFNILKKRININSTINQPCLTNPPLKLLEIEEKLQKQLQGRLKNKGRRNFTNVTNQQLRSLNHKPRSMIQITQRRKEKNQMRQQEDDQQQEEQQYQEQEGDDYPDIQTWKRKNNVAANSKIFIVKGGYSELRNQFINRGWVQNQDVYSKHFDMKWTTKISDIDYGNLKNGQSVNHFNNNHHLTSKYGVTKRLRTLFLNYGIDVDQFYPRCYDLGDQHQLQNFVQDFKFTYAESLANKFIEDLKAFQGKTQIIKTLFAVLDKRHTGLIQKSKLIVNNNFPIVTVQEWQILNGSKNEDQKYSKLPNIQLEIELQQNILQDLHQKISDIQASQQNLSKLFSTNQQYLTQTQNIWIAKPNFLSRGRGIKCFNTTSLTSIADYCLGKQTQFVIQKYIQNPLLINRKKFDIRLWVMVMDYSPPKIYFYQQSYLRFCTEQYNITNINNKYIHLTNNSIQKNNKIKKQEINNSMWFIRQFIDYVGEERWAKIKVKLQNIIVWTIKACEGAVTGKKGSFQFIGFDFMIDDLYNPWLIEVNMSPSMDYSTPVTDKLVKMVLKDTANLIISHNNNKGAKKVGNFTCIYQGDEDLGKYSAYTTTMKN